MSAAAFCDMLNCLKDSVTKTIDLNVCGSVLRLLKFLKESIKKSNDLNVCGSVLRILLKTNQF